MFVGSVFYSPDNNENRVIVLYSIVLIDFIYGLPRRNRGTFCNTTSNGIQTNVLIPQWYLRQIPVIIILFIEDTAKEKRS